MPGPDQEVNKYSSNCPDVHGKARLQQALTNKTLLGQLNGEPPGNLLQLIILQQQHDYEITRLLGYSRHQNRKKIDFLDV